MMDGVQKSLSSKIKKIVKVVPEQERDPKMDEIDEEAVARVEACEKELEEVGERVEKIRKAVMQKTRELEMEELKIRSNVEPQNDDDNDGSAQIDAIIDQESTSEQAKIEAMKGSMTKLGASLVSLAQTMPDKMEGLSKTIEAIQEGQKSLPDEVNEQITKRYDGEEAGEDRQDKSAVQEDDRGEDGEDGEEEDGEDMLAMMVGR